MTQTTTIEAENQTALESSKEFLTILISDQLFGIPILQVQDVLGEQEVTKVPLAPPAVLGSLNLRGRVVTAINVRSCLGLPPREEQHKEMSVVVEHDSELYSLIIDEVGDVMKLKSQDFENAPATLDPIWKNISLGIYKLEGKILVILDVPELLGNIHS